MISWKNSKSNWTMIFVQTWANRWIFIFDIGLLKVFLYVKSVPSKSTTTLLDLSNIFVKKNFVSFSSRLKASIIHPSTDFATLECLFPQLVFQEELVIFLFLFAILEKQESITKESLKFRDSIFRNLKSQKAISSEKCSSTKQYNIIICLWCCDEYH